MRELAEGCEGEVVLVLVEQVDSVLDGSEVAVVVSVVLEGREASVDIRLSQELLSTSEKGESVGGVVGVHWWCSGYDMESGHI